MLRDCKAALSKAKDAKPSEDPQSPFEYVTVIDKAAVATGDVP